MSHATYFPLPQFDIVVTLSNQEYYCLHIPRQWQGLCIGCRSALHPHSKPLMSQHLQRALDICGWPGSRAQQGHPSALVSAAMEGAEGPRSWSMCGKEVLARIAAKGDSGGPCAAAEDPASVRRPDKLAISRAWAYCCCSCVSFMKAIKLSIHLLNVIN